MKISFPNPKVAASKAPPERRPAEIVLGTISSASPRGSTYHRRARGCAREHGLATVAQIHPTREQEALTVGWLVHYVLENYYKLRMLKQKREQTGKGPTLTQAVCEQDALASIAVLAKEPGYEETYEVVMRVCTSYLNYYRATDAHIEILAVEETLFSHKPFPYSCRLDLVIYDPQRKRMYIREFKTTRAMTAVLLEGYQLDLQVLGQAYLFQKCVDMKKYPTFGGVIVDIASKAKEPRFERVEVYPSQHHMAAFESQGRAWERMLPVLAKEGYPQDFSKCSGFSRGYTQCQYFNLCHAFPNHTVAQMTKMEPPFGYAREEREDKDAVEA